MFNPEKDFTNQFKNLPILDHHCDFEIAKAKESSRPIRNKSCQHLSDLLEALHKKPTEILSEKKDKEIFTNIAITVCGSKNNNEMVTCLIDKRNVVVAANEEYQRAIHRILGK